MSGGLSLDSSPVSSRVQDPIIKQFLAIGDSDAACASVNSISSEISSKRIVTLLMSRTLGNSGEVPPVSVCSKQRIGYKVVFLLGSLWLGEENAAVVAWRSVVCDWLPH